MSASNSKFRLVLSLVVSALCVAPSLAGEKSKTRTYGDAQADTALVYFIRPARFGGAARTAFLFSDKTFLGVLDNNSYTFVHAEPGRHVVWTNWAKSNEVHWLPGETYYYRFLFEVIESLEPELGRQLIEQAKFFVTATPGETQKAARHIDKRFEKAQENFSGTHFEAPSAVSQPRPDDVRGLVRVPAKTEVLVVLAQNITSFHEQKGDPVWFRIGEDVEFQGTLVFREGDLVQGFVRRVIGARGGGTAGFLDVVIPSLTTAGGVPVPVVGQLGNLGESRPLKGVWVGGILKGDEAFELAGSVAAVWTQDDLYVEPGVPSPAGGVGVPNSCQTTGSSTRAHFRPHLRRKIDSVVVRLPAGVEPRPLQVIAVDGLALPEPVSPLAVGHGAPEGSVAFDGWSVVRFLAPTDLETKHVLTLAPPNSAGDACYEAEIVLEIDNRR